MYKISETMEVEEQDGELIIIDKNSESVYFLKELEFYILKLIQKHNLDETIRILSEKYDADYDVIKLDVTDFVESMFRKNIIVEK